MGLPLWWDEYGVPRYCQFSPNETANVHAQQAALVEIQCQSCQQPFLVAFSSTSYDSPSIEEAIQQEQLFYGDPPNSGCCAVGPVMTSTTVRVVQFWQQPKVSGVARWLRRAELEKPLNLDYSDMPLP